MVKVTGFLFQLLSPPMIQEGSNSICLVNRSTFMLCPSQHHKWTNIHFLIKLIRQNTKKTLCDFVFNIIFHIIFEGGNKIQNVPLW